MVELYLSNRKEGHVDIIMKILVLMKVTMVFTNITVHTVGSRVGVTHTQRQSVI